MNILIAPTAFKGCLSPLEAAECMESGVRLAIPDARIVRMPIADGGDGTREVLTWNRPHRVLRASVRGPLGTRIAAAGAILRGNTGLVETADASGLKLVPPRLRNPLRTTTYGTGEMLRNMIHAGAREVLLGAGGSATVDGGIGALQALGVRFLDRRGRALAPGGGAMERLQRIDAGRLDPRVRAARITVMVDVSNRLLGARGAAAVFGPQKGATQSMVRRLEAGLGTLRDRVKETFGLDMHRIDGGGAAGGLAASFVAILGARITPGAARILEELDFAREAARADFAITGEGRLDSTTFSGKVVGTAIALLRRLEIPFGIVCGDVAPRARVAGAFGIERVRAQARSERDAMRHASLHLPAATALLARRFAER